MINNRIIYQVDAFTDEPFKGNPAGVMIVDESFPEEIMQRIASEMNLSETAFITPSGSHYRIRYFTPTIEVPLCGHATLASAHVIYKLGIKKPQDLIVFKAKEDELTVTKDADWVTMNFPRYPISKIPSLEGFKEAVGFEPIEMYSSAYGWVIAVAATQEEVANAKPNFEAMMVKGLGHTMITARCHSGIADFVSRCFAPISGINEDPVTGSAHCALTPLWSEKLGKMEMESLQLSSRTGRLRVRLIDNRVEIKGQAITIFKAEFGIL